MLKSVTSKRIFLISEATSNPEQPAKADNIKAFGRSPLFVPPTSSAASMINEPPGLVDSNCMFPFQVVVIKWLLIFILFFFLFTCYNYNYFTFGRFGFKMFQHFFYRSAYGFFMQF